MSPSGYPDYPTSLCRHYTFSVVDDISIADTLDTENAYPHALSPIIFMNDSAELHLILKESTA
jgi:hypothetical protein